MICNNRQCDQKPGWMLLISLFLHLVIIAVFSRAQLFTADLHEAPAYYVDLISLPTAEPEAGTPQPAPTQAPPAPSPAPPSTPPTPAMTQPVRTPAAQPQKSSPSAPAPDSNQEAREFNERLNRLEYNTEAKRQAAVLESLQKKAATKSRSGAPSGSGTTPGYDYGAYIQSRLKDALASTIVYRSKQPEAAVHLYIDRNGKLLRYVMVKPSPDKLFNDSVIRTIEKAKSGFPVTPNGADFDKLYLFSPQEVNKK